MKTHSLAMAELAPWCGAALLLAALTSPAIVACSSPDVHDEGPSPTEWLVTSTNESLSAQVIVHNKTGIEYIAIILDDEDRQVYGFCERYDSNGNIMHDGDPTNGGAFGLELIDASSDDSGTTKTFQDKQTGIAYRWHRWNGAKGYEGQGLVPCRDKDGRVQKWDDGIFISVPVSSESPEGDDATDAPDGASDASDATPDDAGQQ